FGKTRKGDKQEEKISIHCTERKCASSGNSAISENFRPTGRPQLSLAITECQPALCESRWHSDKGDTRVLPLSIPAQGEFVTLTSKELKDEVSTDSITHRR